MKSNSSAKSLAKVKHLCSKEHYSCLIWMTIGMLANGVPLAVLIVLYARELSKSTVSTTAITTRAVLLRWQSTGVTVAGVVGVSGNSANQLNGPFGLVVDSFNTLYIADAVNNRIQQWTRDASSGVTVAGLANGTHGNSQWSLRSPGDIALDSDNNIYVADASNQRIQFWPNGASVGTTVAGTGMPGSGLNQLHSPTCLVRDASSGSLYISDTANHRIICYQVGASMGSVVAGGNGSGIQNTQLWKTYGLHFDSFTNSLLIANYGANNVVRWTLGASHWTLVAGSISGLSGNTSTLLSSPIDVTLDPMGNIYVVDRLNHRVQFFSADGTDGITIAGYNGVNGSSASLLNNPYGVALDNQLNLYVSDTFNHRIQRFQRY